MPHDITVQPLLMNGGMAVRKRVWYAFGIGFMSIALMAAFHGGMPPALAAAPDATPRLAHESPKSPKGNDGITLLLAGIAVLVVGVGIAAGARRERHAESTPPPAEEANAVSAAPMSETPARSASVSASPAQSDGSPGTAEHRGEPG